MMLVLMILCGGLFQNAHAVIPTVEREALIALYNSTDGDNWTDNTNWMGAAGTECTWFGVSCDAGETYAQQLHLSENQLTGSIPAELGKLSQLRSLWLDDNQLSGNIPTELGNLSQLTYLDLSGNQLTGNILAELGNLPQLTSLYLGSNQLTGNIPAELGNLSLLTGFRLNGNQLTGNIPAELGKLSQLRSLWLDDNQLSGNIPTELMNLTDVGVAENWWETFNICQNALHTSDAILQAFLNSKHTSGCDWQATQTVAPSGLAVTEVTSSSATLTWDPIAFTDGEGGYEVAYATSDTSWWPTTGGEGDGDMGDFTAYETTPGKSVNTATVTGLSPDTTYYFRIRTVTHPYLGNQNTVHSEPTDAVSAKTERAGGIPPEEREALIDFYNNTDGDNWANNTNWLGEEGTECSWFGVTCDDEGNHVQHLYLSDNQLVGTIPASVANLTNLESLNLGYYAYGSESSNQLSGEIPGELGSLSQLTHLDLGANQLTGSIPPELGNLSELTELHLWGNQLSGSIPAALANLSQLQKLHLGGNQLSGTIPIDLTNLPGLTELSLSANQLTGDIPAELANLSELTILSLGGNQLTGTIPKELASLTQLRQLELWSNQLTGSIPPELGSLPQLTDLHLGDNQLTGNVPKELGNLSELTFLHLGQNQLSGGIPLELGNLSRLQTLLLFENQLTGNIPSELGNLSQLVYLELWENQLTGGIPPELGSLAQLTELYLNDNQLTGSIPVELGSLSALRYLNLSGNQLTSAPTELANLTGIIGGTDEDGTQSYIDICWNAIHISDTGLQAFLDSRHEDYCDWFATQTIPPEDLEVGEITANTAELTWTPISYTADAGGYEAYYATDPGGEYTLAGTTEDKSAEGITVTLPESGGTWYFRVRTVTDSHENNQSTVRSEFTDPVSAEMNRGPEISGTPVTGVDKGAAYSFTPSAGDPDDDPLTFSIENPPAWADFDPDTGALTGTPGSEDIGTTTGIVISVSDGTESASLPPFDITVGAVNEPPVISGNPSQSATEDEPYSFTPSASDPDGDSLTFSAENQPLWAGFDPDTGALTGTPGSEDIGTTTGIVISVSDGTESASLPAFDITVLAAYHPPTITGDPVTLVAEDTAYSFTPSADDPNGDPLTFSIENQPPWAGFDPDTGTLSGTPGNENVGTTIGIVISVSDGSALASLTPFDLEVTNTNDPPVISGNPATQIPEDTAYSFIPSASDPDGDSLTFAIADPPSWAGFDPLTGALTGTPGDADVGTAADIIITVSDGSADTASLPSFDITVTDTPDAPVISGTLPATAPEDALCSFTPEASDPDIGDVLTFSVTGLPAWAGFDPLTGTLSGTPDNEDVGVYAGVIITVTDASGLSASLPGADITVTNTPDTPVISGTPATEIPEDTAYGFVPSATDPDDDPLTFAIGNKPQWADFDPLSGTLSGIPGNEDVGTTADILISVSDGAETVSLPLFDITVTNTDDAPVISGDPETVTPAYATYRFAPTASDPDAGDSLTFGIENLPDWAEFDADTGELSGFPRKKDVGTVAGIHISVTDASGLSASLAAFDLTVEDVPNETPDTPAGLSPDDGTAFGGDSSVTLMASAFSDSDGDAHARTHWQVRRSDGTVSEFTTEASDESLTQLTLAADELPAGLRFHWRVRYEDGRDAMSSWSDERSFRVGESVTLPWNGGQVIPAGNVPADFRMISFVHWPDDPSCGGVFANVFDKVSGGKYDTVSVRIATYDPLSGAYVECDDGIVIKPGRAYWFMALGDTEIVSEGIPTDPGLPAEVRLSRGDGWNMIACPANAVYDWDQTEVLRYDADGNITAGPFPMTSPENSLVNPRLWRFRDGTYVYYDPDGADEVEGYFPDPDSSPSLMHPHGGYWVRVLADGVALRFVPGAQAGTPESGTVLADAMRRWKTWLRKSLPSPRTAIAGSDDTPPLPLGAPGDSRNASGGSGGCFIDTVRAE